MKKPVFWLIAAAVIGCAVLAVCLLTKPAEFTIDPDGVGSVSIDGSAVPLEKQSELIGSINGYRKSYFPVGADDPNALSVAVEIHCTDGSFYLLHYQYYSGFSFSPKHQGEDDYRSILTRFGPDGKASGAWKLEYEFDSEFIKWYRTVASVSQTYGVYEVTFRNPLISAAMDPGKNTPFYTVSSDMTLASRGEYGEGDERTMLGTMTEISLDKENFDKLFRGGAGAGWAPEQNAASVRKNTCKAWMLVYEQDSLYYLLQQKNGEIYLARGFYDYSEKDDPYSDDTALYWLFRLTAEADVKTELIPGTAYVSYQCVYMNPLSSYAAFGGDSGCIYTVHEDSFEIFDRNSGSQNLIDVQSLQWQSFPYTDEEWAALYAPEMDGVSGISEIYGEILYLPLTAGKFLLRPDGDIWLVELASNKQMGTYIWSIYSLIPEAAMGAAQWEYAPYLSSRSPVFQFRFDMEYTEISASCLTGQLVEFNFGNRISDNTLTFPSGEPLSWSPAGEDAVMAGGAVINFTVHNGDAPPLCGTIYIETSEDTKNGRIYTASLVGTGLCLAPYTEGEGGVISLRY